MDVMDKKEVTYQIPYKNCLINLIDTPGIGDTRGAEQDKENFESILSHISNFDELHAILILLKPNSARLSRHVRVLHQGAAGPPPQGRRQEHRLLLHQHQGNLLQAGGHVANPEEAGDGVVWAFVAIETRFSSFFQGGAR